MNKLTAKEMFMILILVNLIMYYLCFVAIVNPMLKSFKENREQLVEATVERERIKSEIAANEGYLTQISTLMNERQGIYGQSFPDAEPELIHKFMNEECKSVGINLETISINSSTETSTTQDGTEVQSIFKNNIVNLSFNAPYKNIIDLLTAIEDLKRTSAIESISINSGNGVDAASISMNIFTVEKEEKDKIFDFAVPGSTGGTSLNMQ